jgi:DMSO/TMAO reductase YedYZ heme-binding membrane subunit
MAKTNGPASPGIDLSGKKPLSTGSVLALTVSAFAVLWAAALLTEAGRKGYAFVFFFTEFYGGVFTLVTMSLTVMIGLLATDRLILQPRQRVWLQSGHRTLGILSVVFLVFHVLTKVSEGRATALGSAVPFLGGVATGQSVIYVGLGPVAAYLMVAVLWTGLVRRRFAGVGKPWVWRAMHSVAYLSWPIAMLHGLGAGRPPATWVTLSYLACGIVVAIALLLRLSMGRRKRGAGGRMATTTMSTNTTGMRPVGKLAPAVAKRISVEDDDLEPSYEGGTNFAVARLDPPPMDVPRERRAPERVERRVPERLERDERPEWIGEEPVERRQRLEPAVRARRAAEYDEPAWQRSTGETPRARATAPRDRAPVRDDWDEDVAPPRVARRRAVDDEPVGRRRAADDEPVGRRRAAVEEEPVAPRRSRAARRAEEYDEVAHERADVRSPRRGRSADEYLVADEPRRGDRDELVGTAAAYGPPPELRERPRDRDIDAPTRSERRAAERQRDLDLDLDVEPPTRSERRAERSRAQRDAAPVDDIDSRYRATAAAPRYIPSPAPAADDLILADDLPADDTPTLVDLASRRAMRDAVKELDSVHDRDAARDAATKSRRSKRRKSSDKDFVDEEYWGFLRGEAQ